MKIYCKSSEHMDEVKDESIHFIFTSPPYNLSVKYENYSDNLPDADFKAFLYRVFSECYQKLIKGGRIGVNVANTGQNPYRSMTTLIDNIMTHIGYLHRCDVIWDKHNSVAKATSWGSWQSASNPTMREIHEYVMVYCKDTFQREKGESTISRDDFLDATKSIWNIPTGNDNRHPATFPIALPARAIQLYTYKGDTVLDPFMGIGATGVAALMNDRDFIGYDISEKYCEIARERMNGGNLI